MGGNRWKSLGSSLYQALPVDRVEYCPLDLYVMGLMPAEEVGPIELLVNAHSQGASPDPSPSKVSSRVSEPVTVEADVMQLSIDDIIAVEGKRDPDVGFNAKKIRQAWIYVYRTPNQPSYPGLNELENLQAQWDDYFSQATGGRSTMNASLY